MSSHRAKRKTMLTVRKMDCSQLQGESFIHIRSLTFGDKDTQIPSFKWSTPPVLLARFTLLITGSTSCLMSSVALEELCQVSGYIHIKVSFSYQRPENQVQTLSRVFRSHMLHTKGNRPCQRHSHLPGRLCLVWARLGAWVERAGGRTR